MSNTLKECRSQWRQTYTWGCHRNIFEEVSCLVEFYILSIGEYLPTYRNIAVLPS